MRLNLLGLTLDEARALLTQEGVCPQVRVTSAPRRREETRGVLRVVDASQDGVRLTVACFLDPLSAESAGNDRN